MSEQDPKEAGATNETQPQQAAQASAGDVAEATPPAGPTPEELLAAMTAERDKARDQLLRNAADFDNYRKRARKDVEEAERRAKEDVLREVLSIVDNLERAVQAAGSATDVAAVADGVRMVLKGFEDVAHRIGLERVETVGQRFDPALHDAVQQVESVDHDPGTVIAEVQGGYRLGVRLLRPAIVVVSKAPAN